MKSNSLGFAMLTATMGLAGLASFAGCGGDNVAISKGSGGAAGAGGDGGMGGQGGMTKAECGNSKVESPEQCDDGNMMNGDGCETNCSFTCDPSLPDMDTAKCDDGDTCNGAELCQTTHVCGVGEKAPDGTSCANDQICLSGVCSPKQCGDLLVSSPEECEDGNVVDGDGCDNCRFSCQSKDPTRDCTNLDPCVATKCDDNTHKCGSPQPDGSNCGTGKICKNGACTATVCGNGAVEGNEVCDDGNVIDGDGCDMDCTRSCVNPAADCPVAPPCQVAACNANFVCVKNNVGTDPTCMAPNSCQNGACQSPTAVCGNGITETNEDCDFGAGNGANSGCESNCKFSCATDANCLDMNTCNGMETCGSVTVGGKMGQKCSPGMALADCATCGNGVCKAGSCTASTCGDSCVNMMAGEQCDPPNTPTCDSMCKSVICGNSVRETGEQCDDGNTTNMDGCSATCKFEQVQRVNWLQMQYAIDTTFCPANQLGSAIAQLGQPTVTNALTKGVKDGTISIMFQALGLDDLTGTSDPMVEFGSVNAAPVLAPMGVTYDGASDLDWWYLADLTSLDMQRIPTERLSGNITAKVLTAGPGALTLKLSLAGAPATLKMSQARITSSIGNVSTPLMSMTGNTPGHLATENLVPTLQSFTTMGQPTDNGAGKLCGNTTAASLAQVPVPPDLLVGGMTPCMEGYTMQNSLLDVIVGGCRLNIILPVIISRQPDQQDTSAPNVGAGYPYMLLTDAATKKVNGCRDKNMATVDLTMCLADAAYSSFFKFTTDRVIGK